MSLDIWLRTILVVYLIDGVIYFILTLGSSYSWANTLYGLHQCKGYKIAKIEVEPHQNSPHRPSDGRADLMLSDS